MKRFVPLIISLLLCSITSLEGQQRVFSYRHFTVRDGLPHRNNTEIFIDQDGFCWSATDFALSRLDGQEVEVFSREMIGPAVDRIISIEQGPSGRLWLWNMDDCFLFSPSSQETLRAAEVYDPDGKMPDTWWKEASWEPLRLENGGLVFNPAEIPVIIRIQPKSSENFSAGSNQWEVKDPDTGMEMEVHFQRIDLPAPFRLLATGPNGGYWIRTGDRIGLLSPSGELLESVRHPEVSYVRSVHARDGTIYYYTISDNEDKEVPYGFYSLSDKGIASDLIKVWQLPPLRRVYHEAGERVFWIEFIDHWELRSEAGDLLRHMIRTPENDDFFRAVSDSWTSATDHLGGLWIGAESGVSRLQSARSPFRNWLAEKDQYATGDHLSIRGIWANGDTVMASAELNGVWLMEKDSSTKQRLAADYTNYLAGRNLPETFNYALPSDFRGLFRGSDGQFWMGQQRAVIRYDPVEDQYRTYPPAFTYPLDLGINPWTFYEDENNLLWVGMQPGIGIIRESEDSLRYLPTQGDCQKISEAAVYAIQPDQEGTLWVATGRGLFHLTATGGCLGRYWSGGKLNHFLPYDNIYHIYPAGDGRWWIATRGNGLLLFDPSTGGYEQWNRRSGLSDEVIYAAYPDGYGNMWLSSDFGLMRLDTAENVTTTWFPKDGLPHQEFNRVGHFRDEDGRLYFGTLHGIVEVNPEVFKDWKNEPLAPIRIRSYQMWRDDASKPSDLTEELKRDSVIRYRPSDTYLNLEVSLLDYAEAPPTFYYRMGRGEWRQADGGVIRERWLPYGTYPLEIKAQLPDGRWTKEELSLQVVATRPFHHGLLFWVLVALLILGATFAYTRYRTYQLLRYQRELRKRVEAATVRIRQDKELIESQAEELKELDEVKNRFFANVSHELRTPLTLILGPLRNLRNQKGITNKQKRFLNLAEQSGKELLQIVDTILDLGKIEAKGLEVKKTSTHLYDFVRRLLANFESRADMQQLKLLYSYRGDRSLFFEIDQSKLGSIINNLLANAIRFTPTNGRIHLTVSDEASSLLFSVEDTGAGITPEDLPHIFDRFYQARTGEPNTGGSGIGLAFCRELATLLNGEIRAESRVGEGSTFVLSLPRTEVMGVSQRLVDHEIPKENDTLVISPTPIVTKQRQRAAGPKPLIMVVEDNSSMRLYLRSILENKFEVIDHTNGKDALKTLDDQPLPDLILTDIMMPIMDGFALIEAVKSMPALRSLPLIVLTARGNTEDRIKALRFGVDDYLNKPFSEEELLTRINRLLENYEVRKTNPIVIDEVSSVADNDPSEWLAGVEQIVLNHLGDSRLSTTFLAGKVFLSTRQLNRRLKAEAGLTTGEYIRAIRLGEGLRLLESKELSTVKEVAARVGFSDSEYFTQRFRKHFGKTPSSYL